MPDPLAFQQIAQSNIPIAEKRSLIRRMYDSVSGRAATFSNVHRNAMGHVRETGQALRKGAEGAAVGAGLGMLDAEGQLDQKILGHVVPLDGALGALGLLSQIGLANDPYGVATDLGNMGAAGLTVFAFRKTKEWRLRQKGLPSHPSPVAHHGDDEDDPVVLASRM